MSRRYRFWILICGISAACLLSSCLGEEKTADAPLNSSSASSASFYLWAWDRAEDLSWLQKGEGVAYFAVQFDAHGTDLIAQWRRAPLRVPEGTRLLPVLHVEAFSRKNPPVFNDQALDRWTVAIDSAITRLNVPRVQIDYEARDSQKVFYARLLERLNQRFAGKVSISITALASWCGDAAWLNSLPVDEVVPMFFRMGPRERAVWRQRMVQPHLLPERCRTAAGVATDELDAIMADTKAVQDKLVLQKSLQRNWYLFAPRAWQMEDLRSFENWIND